MKTLILATLAILVSGCAAPLTTCHQTFGPIDGHLYAFCADIPSCAAPWKSGCPCPAGQSSCPVGN